MIKVKIEKLTLQRYFAVIALLFTFSPLPHLPWGSAYRYLFYIAAPSCLLVLFANYKNKDLIKDVVINSLQFLAPFTPFLFALTLVCLYHWQINFGEGLDILKIAIILLLDSLLFGLLKAEKIEISKELFLLFCSLSIVGATIYFLYTAQANHVSVFRIRPFVEPYPTILAKCISLLAGICVLGAFVFEKIKNNVRVLLILIGFLGFLGPIGFLSVRATFLEPVIALVAFLFFYRFGSIKTIFTLALTVLVISAGLLYFTPISERFQTGITEIQSVADQSRMEHIFHKISQGEGLTAQEEQMKKSLNNSMGGRIAVWKLALQSVKGNEMFGLGESSPSKLIDLKQLFSYSKDYLPHFHSDFFQAYVMGGIVLLLGLVCTFLALLFCKHNNSLKLFLVLSLISFGIVDFGFLDLRVITVFSGCWVVLSLPLYESKKIYRS